MREILEQTKKKLRNLSRLQEIYFNRNNLIGFQFIGKQIASLMNEKKEIEEEIYATDETILMCWDAVDDRIEDSVLLEN